MTYQISKGQQYDRNGARIAHESLMANYTADGLFEVGHPVALSDTDAVADAVRRVIATGQAETLVISVPAHRIATSAQSAEMQHCPHYTQDQGCPLHGELCAR